MQQHVQPDHVGQLDRPHRHAEVNRRPVDGIEGDAFPGGMQRFEQVREQHPIDQESGTTAARQRQLVDAAREGHGGREHLRAGGRAMHHFHQWHLRYRIEEVQADQVARIRQRQRQAIPASGSRCCWRARRRRDSRGSATAYSARLAGKSSKIASMTTSALATPLPSTSALQPLGPPPPLGRGCQALGEQAASRARGPVRSASARDPAASRRGRAARTRRRCRLP